MVWLGCCIFGSGYVKINYNIRLLRGFIGVDESSHDNTSRVVARKSYLNKVVQAVIDHLGKVSLV